MQMTKLPRRNRAEQLGENLKGLHGVQKKRVLPVRSEMQNCVGACELYLEVRKTK